METNGTIVPGAELVELVDAFNVSPKLANSGNGVDRLRPPALAALAESRKAVWKFVVADPHDLIEVQWLAFRYAMDPVYIMPLGERASDHMAALLALAPEVLAYGYHLAPRLHTLLWDGQRGL